MTTRAKRINARQVRALCGDISDMTLWRWLDNRSFPKPTYIVNRRAKVTPVSG